MLDLRPDISPLFGSGSGLFSARPPVEPGWGQLVLVVVLFGPIGSAALPAVWPGLAIIYRGCIKDFGPKLLTVELR